MQSIGRYQLVERLGQGGMGVVYRAFDTLLQRVVAVKIIGTTVEGNPELRERFFREARAAGQLSHRNIITIHDLGEHDGQPYLAMEYLEGQDLQRRLAGPDRMGLSHKMDIAIEMCEGLTYAHAHGVVHRDIKPANVFITGNGTVKILDFGLARLVTSELTHSNMMMGTLNYMAPEQVRGERADQRADIFSTGVVVYELLSGKKAFEGDSFAATLYKILQEVPEPLLDIDATLPPQLVVIVERALAKPRDERYQTMSDMLRDLMIFRQQLLFHDSPVTGRPAFISGQAGSKPGSDPRLTPTTPMTPMSPIPLSEMPTISQETPIPTHADTDPRAGRGSGSGRVGSGSGTPAAVPSSSTPMPAPAGRRLLPIAVGIGGGVALALAIWIWTQSPGPGTEQTQSAAVRAPAQTSAPATPAPPSPAPPAETGAAASPTTPQPQPQPGVQTSQPPSTRPEQQRTAEPPAARGGRAERPPSQGSRGTRGTTPLPPGSPNAPAADTRSAPAAADPAGRGARSGDPSIPPPTTPPVEAPAPPPPPPPVTVPDRPPASPPSTLPGASQPAPDAAPTLKPTPPPADAAAVPPTTAVRELLGRYEAALESRNLQALKRLWPSLGGREEAALRDEFARASQIEVVIGDPKISVSGASATVEFPRSYQVTVDGQRLRRESRTTMNLRRSGDDWLIEQIRFQPLR